MQHDQLIWEVIGPGFCSFRVKTRTQGFCRNEYNITGLCNRSSCPLANSRYCTIIEKDGISYLCIKTIERAHSPAKLWEKIKLHESYPKALAQLDEHLQYWPKYLVHRAKQRLTKIRQYLIRMRRLRLSVRPKLVGINRKIERRELRREAKAEKAARLDDAIKAEILERLRQGTYSEEEMPNVQSQEYAEALNLVGQEFEQDEMQEDEEEEEEEEEEDELTEEKEREIEEEAETEYVADMADEDEDDIEDQDDKINDAIRKRLLHDRGVKDDENPLKKRRTARVEIEYETETPSAATQSESW